MYVFTSDSIPIAFLMHISVCAVHVLCVSVLISMSGVHTDCTSRTRSPEQTQCHHISWEGISNYKLHTCYVEITTPYVETLLSYQDTKSPNHKVA